MRPEPSVLSEKQSERAPSGALGADEAGSLSDGLDAGKNHREGTAVLVLSFPPDEQGCPELLGIVEGEPPSIQDAAGRKSAVSGERRDSNHDSTSASVAANAVESALALALEKATTAGRWDVVVQLAKELEARQLARTAPNVVSMARKGREGGQR
jgi:hypothetical protein